MRTPEEIVAHIKSIKNEFLGFAAEALIIFLTFDEAKPLLKEGAKGDSWKALPRTEDAVKEEMRGYMEFAWGKVEGHRCISASRSVEKMQAWIWLLGDDALLAAVEAAPYAQYGAPQLAVVCRAYGLPIPKDERITNMIAGDPCYADCDEGCGR